MFPSINPTQTTSWKKLQNKAEAMKTVSMLDLFQDKSRLKDFTLEFQDLHLDFSKNLLDEESLALLRNLAD